jgi:3-hydroxypropanoate dehydrogenase
MTEIAERTTGLRMLDEAGRSALFTDARTANTFADIPVADAELEGIWELAKWAPTAANTQPLRVLYVRTEEGKARLAEHMDEGNKKKVLSAPAVAVLAADSKFHEHIPTVFPIAPQLAEVFEGNAEVREGHATFNTALQAGYFILAVRAMGLAAGPMTGFNPAGVDAEFFPEGRWKSAVVVNIGHPGESPWFDRLPRLDQDEVLSWA